jgi:hypothetical protein
MCFSRLEPLPKSLFTTNLLELLEEQHEHMLLVLLVVTVLLVVPLLLSLVLLVVDPLLLVVLVLLVVVVVTISGCFITCFVSHFRMLIDLSHLLHALAMTTLL